PQGPRGAPANLGLRAVGPAPCEGPARPAGARPGASKRRPTRPADPRGARFAAACDPADDPPARADSSAAIAAGMTSLIPCLAPVVSRGAPHCRAAPGRPILPRVQPDAPI